VGAAKIHEENLPRGLLLIQIRFTNPGASITIPPRSSGM
jgi:hypothetical protein